MVSIPMPNGEIMEFNAPPAALEPSAVANGPPSTFAAMNPSPVLMSTSSLHNKVALVTGASRGIGRGCALELARRGASVIVNYSSSRSAANAVVEEINSIGKPTGCRAVAVRADVSKPEEIAFLFKEGRRNMGRIHLVVSNSYSESCDKTEDITEERYDSVFSHNCKAQFFVGQAAMKYCEDGGRLVLMSSVAAGLLSVRDHALYNASKMAVRGMVNSFATDFGRRGIVVNGIAPSVISSDMFDSNAWRHISGGTPDWPAEEIERLVADHSALRRCAIPEDVARVVAYLSSEDGGWVNGQIITVSGTSEQ